MRKLSGCQFFPTLGATATFSYSESACATVNNPYIGFSGTQIVAYPCYTGGGSYEIDGHAGAGSKYCVGSQFNYVPAVYAHINLPFSFTEVKGSWVSGPEAGGHPDDCNGGPAGGHNSWEESATITDHDGYVMLGTPDEILYPGCDRGSNFETSAISEDHTGLTETSTIIVAVAQSVPQESVLVELAGLQFCA